MKKISIFLTVLLMTCILSVNTISFRSTHHLSHNHNLFTNINKNIAHYLQSHSGQIPESVFNDLTKYVQSDKEIMQSIKDQKPLSPANAQKIKNFFLSNKEFQSFALDTLTSRAKDPKCMNSMKDETKLRVLKIILDQWDFKGIFLTKDHDEELNKAQVNKIVEELNADKEISPFLEKCFGKMK